MNALDRHIKKYMVWQLSVREAVGPKWGFGESGFFLLQIVGFTHFFLGYFDETEAGWAPLTSTAGQSVENICCRLNFRLPKQVMGDTVFNPLQQGNQAAAGARLAAALVERHTLSAGVLFGGWTVIT